MEAEAIRSMHSGVWSDCEGCESQRTITGTESGIHSFAATSDATAAGGKLPKRGETRSIGIEVGYVQKQEMERMGKRAPVVYKSAAQVIKENKWS